MNRRAAARLTRSAAAHGLQHIPMQPGANKQQPPALPAWAGAPRLPRQHSSVQAKQPFPRCTQQHKPAARPHAFPTLACMNKWASARLNSVSISAKSGSSNSSRLSGQGRGRQRSHRLHSARGWLDQRAVRLIKLPARLLWVAGARGVHNRERASARRRPANWLRAGAVTTPAHRSPASL